MDYVFSHSLNKYLSQATYNVLMRSLDDDKMGLSDAHGICYYLIYFLIIRNDFSTRMLIARPVLSLF